MENNQGLKRELTLFHVIFFGLGTILGAGIYALVGKIAQFSGVYAPFSFLLSTLLAVFSALSYAEFSSRYPHSAGDAVFVQAGLKLKQLSLVIGLIVALSGMASSATLAHGFTGYFKTFLPASIPEWTITLSVVLIIGLLALVGIKFSASLIGIITLIEVGGLLFIIWVAREHFYTLPDNYERLIPPLSGEIFSGLLLGAFLAFYAYIGFEDMVNIAEEVKDAKRNMPIAIIISILLASVLYFVVSLLSVLALPVDTLVKSKKPLADIYYASTGDKGHLISIIAMFAVINGATVQIIMASRILYGMSKEGWLPPVFSSVYSKTQTPVFSTILVTLIIVVLALSLGIVNLASYTSSLLLTVFALINLSLVIVKIRDGSKGTHFKVWIIVPVLGFLSSTAVLIYKIYSLF